MIEPCIRRSFLGRYAETVRLAQPGEIVLLEVFFRNADGCACPRQSWSLSYGYHPPHDSTPPIRIGTLRLVDAAGAPFPNYLDLAPGEEASCFMSIEVRPDQDVPGYVTPSIFVVRTPKVGNYMVDYFDIEGTAVGCGMPYEELRAKVYPPQPPT